MKRLTVHLEDHGQDFLEWDIEDGIVVGCRPAQGWMWNGTAVHNEDIQKGDVLEITTPSGAKVTLYHRVERVRNRRRFSKP